MTKKGIEMDYDKTAMNDLVIKIVERSKRDLECAVRSFDADSYKFMNDEQIKSHEKEKFGYMKEVKLLEKWLDNHKKQRGAIEG